MQCKEDMIFALALQVFSHVSNVYDRVLKLPLTTPEKILATALICPSKVQVYPFDSQLEIFVSNEYTLKRASLMWNERMAHANGRCQQAFRNVIDNAALSGELMLVGEHENHAQDLYLGAWAIVAGFKQVQRATQYSSQLQGPTDETSTHDSAVELNSPLVNNIQRLLNSYDWEQPLTDVGIQKSHDLLVKEGFR
ncbi:MAG: hypothetical protein ACI9LM_001373 [Alteromonadaceae bacterium]|jgi:hypothetical protein